MKKETEEKLSGIRMPTEKKRVRIKAKNPPNLKPAPVLKDFWRNNNRFADLCNQVLFRGEAVMDPGKLSDRDPEESSVLQEKEYISSISRAGI